MRGGLGALVTQGAAPPKGVALPWAGFRVALTVNSAALSGRHMTTINYRAVLRKDYRTRGGLGALVSQGAAPPKGVALPWAGFRVALTVNSDALSGRHMTTINCRAVLGEECRTRGGEGEYLYKVVHLLGGVGWYKDRVGEGVTG